MKQLARAVLIVEPLLLAIMVASFWFPESYRANTLLLLIPPALARLILYRRLWVSTPLNLFFFAYIALCLLNTYIAMSHPGSPPYSWGWYEAGKPVMGVALALGMITIVYERGHVDGALLIVLLVSLLVGVLGLVSAQYLDTKSGQLQFLIDLVPKYTDFPGAVGGFNVNEIGGAMAFFAPFSAGIAIYEWRKRASLIRLVLATMAFAMMLLALFLGQSRFALIGVLLVIGVLIFLLIPARGWRYGALAVWLVVCLLEVGLIMQVFVPKSSGTASTSASATNDFTRDESSLAQRPVIWGAALGIIRDYPLTGVGLNEFRSRLVRAKYPVPNFAMTIVPHAHNELLQVGTDTGIPGMILYIGWHVALALMVWRAWRQGDPFVKAVAASAAAGLIAHAFFGLGDAITMYDRFGFAYWLFVGMAGSAYILACHPGHKSVSLPLAETQPDAEPETTSVPVSPAI